MNTVTSGTVFLVSLGDTLDRHDPSPLPLSPGGRGVGVRGGQVVGINQVVWDVATNTLHVESDELLNQHTRYALIVTNGLRDVEGRPVEASAAFRRFRQTVDGDYKHNLLDAVRAARRLGIRERDLVTASVFTTQSITSVLEKIRDQIKAETPEPADFLLGPDGTRTVFQLDQVTGITVRRHTGVSPDTFGTPQNLNLPLLRFIPGAVGQVAYGKYVSPDYMVHPGEFIPPIGTRTGTPDVQGTNETYFNLYLPAGEMPEGGWPVAIFGHGSGESKDTTSLSFAAIPASRGIAVIAINAVGNGQGPLGDITVNRAGSAPVNFAAGGRGFDQNGDRLIGAQEGAFAAPPRLWTIGGRDQLRQTVVDLMQLVRVIEVGMDTNGDGTRDLDPSRIHYYGSSLGAFYGTHLVAVEPAVQAAGLIVAGGMAPEHQRHQPGARPMNGSSLAARTPSLLNSPGITEIDGIPVSSPHYNENKPLRNQPPVINTVEGAVAIQEVFEWGEWGRISGGTAVAYAPYLRKTPLAGVPPKSVLYLFAKGDQQSINPGTTAVLRAGDLADRAVYFRNDLAFDEDPTIPKNPHAFAGGVLATNPLMRAIARGAQEQVAVFLETGGTVVIHPESRRFFEVPIQGPLPEELNFIP